MQNELAQLVLRVLTLVLGAGLEELLPSVGGVGFPILLVAVQALAVRGTQLSAILFAVAAGAMEDSLSGLAPMTSVGYFLLVTLLVRRVGMPSGLTVLTYPVFQLWLAIWTGGMNVFSRTLLAFPIGMVTAVFVVRALAEVIRKAAIDEQA